MINQKIEPVQTSANVVLVVDDMEANRAVISRRLERLGYEIKCVDSGPAALRYIADSMPGIVLLDYMMPQMSGIEVLRTLRQNPTTCELPVIMVTARAESEATIEALEAGADDYVTKPIDFDVLRARMETHLNKRTNSDDLKRANAALDERVTVRSMAIADLEDELRHEIEKRRELERKLSEALACGQPSSAADQTDELQISIEQISEKFEIVFKAATAGRMPNFAQMAELRLMLEKVRGKLGE